MRNIHDTVQWMEVLQGSCISPNSESPHSPAVRNLTDSQPSCCSLQFTPQQCQRMHFLRSASSNARGQLGAEAPKFLRDTLASWQPHENLESMSVLPCLLHKVPTCAPYWWLSHTPPAFFYDFPHWHFLQKSLTCQPHLCHLHFRELD